jgi:hypothetical protein
MKLNATIATIVVVLGTALQAPAQIQVGNPTTITMETNLDARASFDALGQRAGINVVSRSLGAAPVHFKVENASVTEALDLLAKQTGAFWTPWDTKTILVFPDSADNRARYERQFLRKIPVGQPEQVLRELRDNHQFRGAISGNGSILLRDTSARIHQAEMLLGKTSTPVGGADVASLYLTGGGGSYRTPDSVRSQLKIQPPGPVSLNVTDNIRSTFEKLATMSGVNVVVGRSFPTRTHTFHIDGVDSFDALDLLAIETGTFWQPVNETTIVVYDDTPQNRRDFESQLIETVYLSSGVSTQKLTEIMGQLRGGLFPFRGIYQDEAAKAVFVRDRTSNVLQVEALIEELSGGAIRKEVAAGILEGFSESGGPFQTPSGVRSKLQTKVAGTISLRMNGPVQEVYGNLARTAGFDLLFSGPSRNVDFNVDGQNIIDALDMLASQSSTLWQPLDSRTIQVLDDTQQNRRDFETHNVKTIYLPSGTSTSEMNGIMNLLRTALSLRGIYQHEGAKAIFLHDTPGRVALAERIVRQLNVRPDAVTSLSISAPGLTESMMRSTAAVARPTLQVAPGPVSMNINADVRPAFEALANMAGLSVSFDPRVVTGSLYRFNVNGADVLDALDYLSYQTRTFWKVVDDRSILVAPDTQQVHAELDPRVTKIFYLKSGATSADGILNVLRTAMSLRQVLRKDSDAIEMSDTPQRVALAEQIVASLDKVR